MKATVKVFLLSSCLYFLHGPGLAQTLPRNVPLPPDLQLHLPNDTLPPEVKGFVGKWVGTWDGILDHVLIVEDSASAEQVSVVYAFGLAPI